MMAVRKDWGLKKPDNQTEEGRLKSEVQDSSSLIRRSRSAYHADKPFSEAYASFVQEGGTWIKGRHNIYESSNNVSDYNEP